VVDKLKQGAWVADVGCGHGASTVVMAKAFPKSHLPVSTITGLRLQV
jgi:tRNA G46 methylase TrmB